MDAKTVEDRLFKTAKRFGKLIGSWPFGERGPKLVGGVIVALLVLSSFATQMAYIIIFYSTDVLVEQIIYLGSLMGLTVKYSNSMINQSKFASLLSGLFKDWETIESKEELAIMNVYADRGTFFVNMYLATAYFGFVVFTQIPFAMRFLDHVSNENETRELLYVYPAHYFVNGDDYYYIRLAHMSIIVMLVLLVYVSCDANYMTLVQHACGLLAVAGYRFKHAIRDRGDGNEKNRQQLLKVDFKNLRYSIQGHTHALKFVAEVEKAYKICFLLSMVCIVSTFCVTLVKASMLDMSAMLIKYIVYIIVQLIHLLFLTVQGQFVMNAGDEVYKWIYEGLWYNTAPKLQALYLLALRGSLVNPIITAGGFIVLNLPTFAEVVKVSVSYYTVLRTT